MPEARVLDESDIEHYRQQGYLIVRRLLSKADIAEAVEDADRLTLRRELIVTENLRCRWQPHVKTQECLFECFDPVIDISPVCNRLAHEPRLLGVLGDLYGEEACLFKDKLIFKPPGAKGYDLHQEATAVVPQLQCLLRWRPSSGKTLSGIPRMAAEEICRDRDSVNVRSSAFNRL